VIRELRHQLRWSLPVWAVGLITNWWPDNRVSCRVRGALVRPFIKECGRRLELGAHVTLLNTHRLVIGDDVYIARGTWLNALADLHIESEVVIAPYVVISTLQHVFTNRSVRFGGSIGRSVRIKRGTWLAAHTTVRCGVTVGRGCIVAANSCVTADTPDDAIVGGVPARFIAVNTDGAAAFSSRSELEL
jgi:acetyltransferase-like isoleucine patch superfamily enzyme